jgi:hypothetical protein
MLLSLFLLAVLLSFLFGFFTQSVKAKAKMEIAKHYALEKQRLSSRLNQVFSAVSSLGSKEGIFYTDKDKSLHFFFDNGIDPSPAFCGPVKAKLFLKKGNVYLETEPVQKKENQPLRTETLFSSAQTCQLQFLDSSSDKNSSESFCWKSDWPKEKSSAPSLIKLELSTKEENLSFAFFLPQEDIPVTYLKITDAR